MECLKKHLREFKDITLELIGAINKEDYDKLDELINCRQTIIQNIIETQYKKQDFQHIVKEFKIIECDKKFRQLMELKRHEYRKEMKKYILKENASTMYNKDLYGGSTIFSKKI